MLSGDGGRCGMLRRVPVWRRREFIHATAVGAAGAVTARRSVDTASASSSAGAGSAHGLAGLTLCEAADLVRDRKVSPVDLTRACLERIERLDPKLNAFITVTAESAIAEARAAESEVRAGRWRGPLHGVPIALKDLADTAGVRTTAGSAVFADRVPTEDAFVVGRLKAAGAVYILAGDTKMSLPGEGIHEMGTARMGADPAESVLNAHNQAHDVPNLFITDGSFMTSSSCVNPSLTYMAFTARACDYAVKQLAEGRL